MYIVRICRKAIVVEMLGLQKELPLSFTPGMVGAMPVFDNYDDALEYSDNRPELVIEAREVEKAAP